MLSESKVKEIIDLEKQHLESIVDPVERKYVGSFIAGLECVLND